MNLRVLKMTALPTSAACFDHIQGLHQQDIDLGLDRFLALLHRLGNPHKNGPPAVHCAGTNGKGSTLAFLRSVYEAAGWKVHSFTSPHFLRPHECITLAGHEVNEDTLCQLLNQVIAANDGAPLTVFEALSATAFLGFAHTHAHITLLETGMGGRGDCTNVVDQPLATLLTPISFDHQDFLGSTLAEIAAHKAGILKAGVPCIMASQDADAYQIIRSEAHEKTAPLYRQGREWFVKKAGKRLIFEGWRGDHAYPIPAHMVGDHQIQNAGLALATLQVLEDHHSFPQEVIANGLANTHWAGRLETVPALPDTPNLEIWLDGGHNAAAALALATQAQKWQDQPLYCIFGMLARKNEQPFIEAIAPHCTRTYTVPITGQDHKDPDALAAAFKDHGTKAKACRDIAHALKKIQKRQDGAPARVLICGSLSMVASYYQTYGT